MANTASTPAASTHTYTVHLDKASGWWTTDSRSAAVAEAALHGDESWILRSDGLDVCRFRSDDLHAEWIRDQKRAGYPSPPVRPCPA